MSIFTKDTPPPPRQLGTARLDGSVPYAQPRDLDQPYDPLAPLEDALRERTALELREAMPMPEVRDRPYISPPPPPPPRRPTETGMDIQFNGKTLRIQAEVSTREEVELVIGLLTAWTPFFQNGKDAKAPSLEERMAARGRAPQIGQPSLGVDTNV
jgi:hypothetical protein